MFQSQTGHARCTTLWETNSPRGQGSICMRAKHGCGTKKASAHPEWRSLGQRWSPRGVKIVGTPLGSDAFEEMCEEWLQSEQELWDAIPSVPDLQCAWQVLVQCAGARCHHLLRTLPPDQSHACATRHDEEMREVMATPLHGLPGDMHSASRRVRMGGLGLRSASKMAPTTFWASLGPISTQAILKFAHFD